MQNKSKMNKYVMLGIIFGILIPINYFIFSGSPSVEVEEAEEQIIKDVTGIDIKLNPQ